MRSLWMVVVLVGCAGAHGAQELEDVQVPPVADALVQPQEPTEDAGPELEQDAGQALEEDAQAPAPDAAAQAPQDAGQARPDAATPRPDAGTQAPDGGQGQADAQLPQPDAGAGQPDAAQPAPDASQGTEDLTCLDVAPQDPARELLGGSAFDCQGTAPCTEPVTNASLVRAWCGTAAVPIGTGFQVRWWGYATQLPEVQVPRSACVRIRAAGECVLVSSFGSTVTRWVKAPQVNARGWVEVDVSMPGALACDLTCSGG